MTPHSKAALSPMTETIEEYLQSEVSRVVSIYTCLYPTEALKFVFYEGDDPVWGAPVVIDGPFTFRPEHLGTNFLGQFDRPGTHIGAPSVTIRVSIPRQALPSELTQNEEAWLPARLLRPVYKLSPILYEKIRYQAEVIRQKQAVRKHPTVSMQCGYGRPSFPRATKPNSDKRPAILIGMHWLEMGGAEKLGFDTIEWALEAGLRVFVVTNVPAIQRLADKLPKSEDITFIRLDRYLPHALWSHYIEKLTLAENIQIIHNHHCNLLYECLPQIRANLPWVKVVDSTHIVEYTNGGYAHISGVWSNFIDIHHVISKELVGYYSDKFQVTDKVKLGRMLYNAKAPDELPQFNMSPSKKRLSVAFVGRLYYQKRPIVVVEAMRALSVWAKSHSVEFSGTIIGEGPFLDEVTLLVKRYGLVKNVKILPASSPVGDILSKSDILLLPSNNEGLALVCYEAIAEGCIPISTDVGSQNEIVPRDLLVSPEPAAAIKGIVRAVDQLWKDPEFMSRQRDALLECWSAIALDPTAKDILMPIYNEIAANV